MDVDAKNVLKKLHMRVGDAMKGKEFFMAMEKQMSTFLLVMRQLKLHQQEMLLAQTFYIKKHARIKRAG